ncbi:MAG: ABC transporter permease [Alicyclobacillus sp.]|nr:ABC transporter permease [Alicyclobacillus sp.]
MTISELWDVLRRHPASIVGLAILLIYFVFAVIGPMLYPPILTPDPMAIYLGPSWQHPLGTDYAGRDVLALIIIGTRAVIEVAVIAALFTVVIGGLVGLMSGLFGGWIDALLMRITDVFLTVPGFPLLVLIAALTTLSNPLLIAALLSFTSWGGLARAVRSQVLSYREREYVEAAKSLRLGSRHIAFREIMPNLMPYVIMNLMLGITGAIYAEVGLFYLGVLPFNSNNWGVMLNLAYTTSGAIYSSKSVLYLLSPMGAILLLQLGIILVLRFAEEIFNPRLRAS